MNGGCVRSGGIIHLIHDSFGHVTLKCAGDVFTHKVIDMDWAVFSICWLFTGLLAMLRHSTNLWKVL